MEAKEYPLRPLLEGTLQYQVPLYQRGYAWTQREWSNLWKSISRQYLLAQGDEDGPSHFLGSFVFAPAPGMPATPAQHRVVDGQQRITTLMVLLVAMRDVLSETDATATDRFNELYLTNKWQQGNNRYKLIPSQTDRAAFLGLVDGAGAASATGVGAAYAFFRNELIKAQLEGLDFTVLEEAIVDRLWVVGVSTAAGDSVHRIFQTLNSSGVALDQVDLLRNHFFMLLPTQGEEVYEQYWRPLEVDLGIKELDYFLWADLICMGREYDGLPRRDVYSSWQRRLETVEGDEAAVVGELQRLRERGAIYRTILRPDLVPEPNLRAALERTLEWGSSIHRPIVLKIMLDLRAGSLTLEDALRCLHLTESYLVRRLIAKLPTNNLNRIFTTLLAALDGATLTPAELHRRLSVRANYWPSNTEIKARARSEEFYRAQQAPQRQFVLRRLEEFYANAEVVNWAACEFTVEHIMPQTLTEDWFAYLEGIGDEPIRVHSELLHTLGNATLTCYNPALSNSPFEVKRPVFEESGLRMNHRIAEVGQWSRQAILDRSDELATAVTTIWDGPLGLDDAGPDDATVILMSTVSALPPGRWTSYAELAAVSELPVTSVMKHLREHPTLPGVHRVARSNGEMDVQAPWAAKDIEAYMQLLAGEGALSETEDGPRLAAEGRLGVEELAALLEEP